MTHLESPTVAEELTHGRAEHQPVPVASDEKAFSRWLDFFRWVAALSVVCAHTEGRMLMRIMEVTSAQRTVPYYLLAFAAGFAHQAVMIFFVLSGYLVGGGLLREARKKRSIDLPVYLVKRVSRLCIVLYPAFLLIAVLNLVGIYFFHGIQAGIYPKDILGAMGLKALVLNAAFLHTALWRSYGADGALWSLFNEFWYYLIWPLILIGLLIPGIWKRALFLGCAGLLLTILTVLQFDGSPVGPYMLIWLLGVGVALVPRPIVRSFPLAVALFLAGSLAVRLFVRLTYEDTHPVGLFFIDLLVSTLFANLLVTMKFYKALRSPIGKDWNYALAAFSFSLYCIHTPILNLYAAVMHNYTGLGWKMVPAHWYQWGIPFGAILLSVVGAFLFSRVTEARTANLRGWLIQRCKLDNPMRLPTVRL